MKREKLQNCKNCFQRFKCGNFYIGDKKNILINQKKIENGELEALLEENSTQTEKVPAKQLNATQTAISNFYTS